MWAKKEIFGGAVLVAVLAASSMLLSVAGVKIDLARERAMEAAWLKRIEGVIDAEFDNDLIGTRRTVSNAVLFGTSIEAQYWTLLRGRNVVGYAIQVPVPEAYNGMMGVIVGIGADGRVTGVGVPEHTETPSYGGLLIASARFLASFIDRDGRGDGALWQVVAGESAVDGVTGATITKNAVTNGVFRALRIYEVLTAAGTAKSKSASGVE